MSLQFVAGFAAGWLSAALIFGWLLWWVDRQERAEAERRRAEEEMGQVLR